MRRIATLVSVAALAASCARETPQPSGTTAPRAPVSSSSGASSAVGASPSAASPSASPSAASPSAPSPIVITNLASGEFQLDARASLEVATTATLERRSEDGGWEALHDLDLGAGYRLVETCPPTAAPACVSLTPGMPLFPVPWQGFSCSAQCNLACRANVWEGEGTFHLVVRACDGSTSATGPSFTLPGSEITGAAFERWKVTTDVLSARVMRLELPATRVNPADPAPASLTGFGIKRGTGIPVDRAVIDGLVKALRNPRGFDDQIQKRCLMSHIVGFRLRRSLATTGDPREQDVDVSVDFTCQKLFIARAGTGAKPPSVHATHFDPSRSTFLALVKKALPDDAEIRALK